MRALLLIYLLSYGGAAASLLNPFIGVLAYVSLSILRPESLWPWSVPAGNYSRIVGIGMLVGWAIRGTGSWHFGQARAIVGAFIAFFLWSMVSASKAPNQEVAWNFVLDFSKIALPFLIGVTIIRSQLQLYALLWVVTICSGYVCLSLNMTYLQGHNVVDGWGGMGRAVIATALVMTTSVAFFLGLYEDAWWRKALALGSCAMQLHAIMLSFSRGGMLGLVTSGVTALLIIPKKWSHYLVFGLVVLLGIRLAGPELTTRYSTVSASRENRDASAESRLDLWQDCLDVIAKHPVFGVGPDHWPLIASDYGWESGKEAHNNWLQNGAELGLPGMLFLAGTFGMCLIRSFGVLSLRDPVADPLALMIAHMSVVALAGFFVSSQFVTIEMLEHPYYVMMIGAASLKVSSIPTEADDGRGASA